MFTDVIQIFHCIEEKRGTDNNPIFFFKAYTNHLSQN